MASDSCGVCGGDGRVGNAFGLTTTCPSCHGSGRRSIGNSHELRDVTKTKPSHYRQANKVEVIEKQKWPSTFEGGKLATEVRDSTGCSSDVKAKLIREIIDYEGSHGRCTETFVRKVRKQIRPRSSP